MVISRWHRDGDTAEIRFRSGSWEAWNRTRGQLAVVPDDAEQRPSWERGGFYTSDGLEAALVADGWERA